jgi:hypothetical protein
MLLWALSLSCAPVIEEPPEQEVASRRQLAAGRYSTIGLDGSEAEGGFVAALRDPDDTGGTLELFPFDGGASCDAGRAEGFATYGVGFGGGVLLSTEPMRLAVRESIDELGGGPSRFVDAHCADAPPGTFELLRPPLLDYAAGAETFIGWTRDGDVVRIDPRAGTSATLASGVTRFEPGWVDYEQEGRADVVLWTVESGSLVARSSTGEELLRTGTGVTELSVACPILTGARVRTLIGYCFSLDAAYRDADGLHVTGDDETIATDACEPTWLPGIEAVDPEVRTALPPMLAYLSPCAERRLHLRVVASGADSVYEPDVSEVRRLANGEILFAKGDGPAPGIGSAWVVESPGAAALVLAPNVELGTVTTYTLGLVALANHDGTSGELGLWTAATGFVPAIERVAEFSQGLLLAILSDYEGDTGTLQVVDVVSGASEDAAGPITRPAILQATGVPRGGFRWSPTIPALDYLEDVDTATGAGRLRTWLLPDSLSGDGPGGEALTGEEGFVVDEGVSEWREIQWPDAGELYVIKGGDREGLWYADWVD